MKVGLREVNVLPVRRLNPRLKLRIQRVAERRPRHTAQPGKVIRRVFRRITVLVAAVPEI